MPDQEGSHRGTGGDGTPMLPAGRGAAHGLPCLQRSSPMPLRMAGHPKRSEQTGAGGRAGMIPALIISVPPYMNAAVHSLRRSAAKHCARWTTARATGSVQKLPVQPCQPVAAPLANGVPTMPPHLWGEGREAAGLGALGLDAPNPAPMSSLLCTHIPTAARRRDGETTPGRPAAKGLKCLVIPFIPRLHLFAD